MYVCMTESIVTIFSSTLFCSSLLFLLLLLLFLWRKLFLDYCSWEIAALLLSVIMLVRRNLMLNLCLTYASIHATTKYEAILYLWHYRQTLLCAFFIVCMCFFFIVSNNIHFTQIKHQNQRTKNSYYSTEQI